MFRCISQIKLTLIAALIWSLPVDAQNISVTPVPKIDRDLVGIISPLQAGVSAEFWQDSNRDALIDALLNQTDHHNFVLRKFIQRLALTELAGPQGDDRQGYFLAARLDLLIEQGAIDEADALLRKTKIDTPILFQRWFDVQLLLEQPISACDPLRARPALSPDLSISVYCMAINQDWFGAELLLVNAMELGQISQDMGNLLSVFLEPDLLEELEIAPLPAQSSILQLTIADALDIPRLATLPPIGYLHRDLSASIGWLQRLRAAERLTKSGALSPRYLSELYSEGIASASGELWDRVRFKNRLLSTFAAGEPSEICEVFLSGMDAFQLGNMLPIYARMIAEELSLHPFTDETCIDAQIKIILMHPKRSSYLFDLVEDIETTDVLYGLVTGDFENVKSQNAFEEAVLKGFSNQADAPTSLDLLNALKPLVGGTEVEARKVEQAITLLRAKGLEEVATDYALELIILDRLS